MASTNIFTLSLHDALPIWHEPSMQALEKHLGENNTLTPELLLRATSKDDYCFDAVELLLKGLELKIPDGGYFRSEEHTSELQSRPQLVCRLLLEKKKIHHI